MLHKKIMKDQENVLFYPSGKPEDFRFGVAKGLQ